MIFCLTSEMSHAHPERGWSFERGCHERKRTDGERWLWRLVRPWCVHRLKLRVLLRAKYSRPFLSDAQHECELSGAVRSREPAVDRVALHVRAPLTLAQMPASDPATST